MYEQVTEHKRGIILVRGFQGRLGLSPSGPDCRLPLQLPSVSWKLFTRDIKRFDVLDGSQPSFRSMQVSSVEFHSGSGIETRIHNSDIWLRRRTDLVNPRGGSLASLRHGIGSLHVTKTANPCSSARSLPLPSPRPRIWHSSRTNSRSVSLRYGLRMQNRRPDAPIG